MMEPNLFHNPRPFVLESGKHLPELTIGYHTYGRLNQNRDNVIWVCHAFTANSDVLDWWHGLFGESWYFNPAEYYIVCANVLASCYGTTGPLSLNPADGNPYYLDFSNVTIRDMVKAHQLLANHLGIDAINVLIGGSIGGQQALEWSIIEPDRIKSQILIASNARHSPFGIAINESQRMAIAADNSFYKLKPDGGANGLKAARAMGLTTYRTYDAYAKTQQDDGDATGNYRAVSYQQYQGEKLVKRFNAYSYWYLTIAMDSHNAGRGRGGIEQALSKVTANTLVIGISSDTLFPVIEQRYLAENITGAAFEIIDSEYGHDGFLVDTGLLTDVISAFLKAC